MPALGGTLRSEHGDHVLAIAIVLAVLVMLLAARAIGEFVDAHPTIKMLALSFLILGRVTHCST